MKNECNSVSGRSPDDRGNIAQKWLNEGDAIAKSLVDSGDMGDILGTIEQLGKTYFDHSEGATKLAKYVAAEGNLDEMIAAMRCFEDDTEGGRILAEGIVKVGDRNKMLEALGKLDELSSIRQKILVRGILEREYPSVWITFRSQVYHEPGQVLAKKIRDILSIVDGTRKGVEDEATQ